MESTNSSNSCKNYPGTGADSGIQKVRTWSGKSGPASGLWFFRSTFFGLFLGIGWTKGGRCAPQNRRDCNLKISEINIWVCVKLGCVFHGQWSRAPTWGVAQQGTAHRRARRFCGANHAAGVLSASRGARLPSLATIFATIPAFQHSSMFPKDPVSSPCGWGGRAAAARTGGELRTRRVVFVNHAGMLECWNGAEDLRIAGVIGGRARQKSSSPCGWRVTLRLGSQPAPRSALHFSLVLKVVLRVGALRIARVQNICES